MNLVVGHPYLVPHSTRSHLTLRFGLKGEKKNKSRSARGKEGENTDSGRCKGSVEGREKPSGNYCDTNLLRELIKDFFHTAPVNLSVPL